MTWKRNSNYTMDDANEAIAQSTDIYNVNPVYMGALGQLAGNEENVMWGKSYVVMEGIEGVYGSTALQALPTVMSYLLHGGWLEVITDTFVQNFGGFGFTYEAAMAQWNGYGFTIAAGAFGVVVGGVGLWLMGATAVRRRAVGL